MSPSPKPAPLTVFHISVTICFFLPVSQAKRLVSLFLPHATHLSKSSPVCFHSFFFQNLTTSHHNLHHYRNPSNSLLSSGLCFLFMPVATPTSENLLSTQQVVRRILLILASTTSNILFHSRQKNKAWNNPVLYNFINLSATTFFSEYFSQAGLHFVPLDPIKPQDLGHSDPSEWDTCPLNIQFTKYIFVITFTRCLFNGIALFKTAPPPPIWTPLFFS